MKLAFETALPKLVVAPAFVLGFAFIYGLMIWNGVLSLTASRMLPNYDVFVGLAQYARLWDMDRWWQALRNLGLFTLLYVGCSMGVGLGLAILLDQKVRAEGALRTLYLYPMALSFVVTGTAWKWVLDPSLGLQKLVRDLGWSDFTFDWLVQSDTAIYCVVVAGVWQSAGFAMALFLAGLRGIDDCILKAAQIDGASLPRIYWRVILPMLRPVVFSIVMVLSHLSIKSFDLVMTLTGGGPGYASDVPATFMYTMSFTRGQIGLGAASATLMLATVAAIVVPFLYSELRSKSHER
jgi:glucose/mannose transport system permease protein